MTDRPSIITGGWVRRGNRRAQGGTCLGHQASTAAAGDRSRSDSSEAGPLWLRDFFPGYFALVMGTGIVAVAARLTGRELVAWVLFYFSLAAYPVLWGISLAWARALSARCRGGFRQP